MFQFPLKSSVVTTRFVMYTAKGYTDMHWGMDFGCATGTPLYAANSGVVVMSTYDSAGGNMVAIHDGAADELSRYAHLSRRDVKVGDVVTRGQQIGLTGNTGSATTGPHLHFETWLVPPGYTYAYADRTRYAVDPMSVCHLFDGQTYDQNGLETCEPVPYPEPANTVRRISGRVDVDDTAVRLRLIPEVTRYQYIVGGRKRAYDTLGRLVSGTSFDALAVCDNDGYEWALIKTDRGQFWVAIQEGMVRLTVQETEPVAPTPPPDSPQENERVKQLEAELAEANERIKRLEVDKEILRSKVEVRDAKIANAQAALA